MSSERALLWDVDGTLIDTTKLIVGALDHVYTRFCGRSMSPDYIREIIGIPLREQVAILGSPECFGATAEEMEREFIRYYEDNRNLERVVQEAVETLKAGSRSGIKTALVTSKNDQELANTLPRLGIERYVQSIIGADQVKQPKPDPEGVRLALSALGTSAAAATYIGDTVHDMRAAKAAGVRRCAVSWGAGTRDLLLAEAPELLCDDPACLAPLLKIRLSVK